MSKGTLPMKPPMYLTIPFSRLQHLIFSALVFYMKDRDMPIQDDEHELGRLITAVDKMLQAEIRDDFLSEYKPKPGK
jgi:hypothetical protein